MSGFAIMAGAGHSYSAVLCSFSDFSQFSFYCHACTRVERWILERKHKSGATFTAECQSRIIPTWLAILFIWFPASMSSGVWGTQKSLAVTDNIVADIWPNLPFCFRGSGDLWVLQHCWWLVSRPCVGNAELCTAGGMASKLHRHCFRCFWCSTEFQMFDRAFELSWTKEVGIWPEQTNN